MSGHGRRAIFDCLGAPVFGTALVAVVDVADGVVVAADGDEVGVVFSSDSAPTK